MCLCIIQSREDSLGTSMTRMQQRLRSELDSIADECVEWYSQWLKFSSRQIVIFRLLANNKFFDEVKNDVNDVIARLQAELPETMESQNYDADLRRIYQDVFHIKMQKLEGEFGPQSYILHYSNSIQTPCQLISLELSLECNRKHSTNR